MKIRNGFVSNSSSSSFMLIGKKININDICDADIKDRSFIVVGKQMGDGDDIFYIESVEMLWFVKSAQKVDFGVDWFEGFEIYETHKTQTDWEHLEFEAKDLPEGKLVATQYYKDYSASSDVSSLFNNYLFNDDKINEFNRIYNRYQRKQKLKNIKNEF